MSGPMLSVSCLHQNESDIFCCINSHSLHVCEFHILKFTLPFHMRNKNVANWLIFEWHQQICMCFVYTDKNVNYFNQPSKVKGENWGEKTNINISARCQTVMSFMSWYNTPRLSNCQGGRTLGAWRLGNGSWHITRAHKQQGSRSVRAFSCTAGWDHLWALKRLPRDIIVFYLYSASVISRN